MENITYTVITLDRKENKNISLDTIKDWYSKRLLHEDSLVYSAPSGKWQMLEKAFNLLEFPPRVAYRQSSNANSAHLAQAPNAQFQTPAQYQPTTFQTPSYQSNYQSPKPSSAGKKIAVLIGLFTFVAFAIGGYLLVPVVLQAINSANSRKKEDKKLLTELKQIEVPGKDFTDQETGATLSLPNNWRFIKPQNSIIKVPDAKIIATDDQGNKSAMLEVVTIPSPDGKPVILPPDILETTIKSVEDFLRTQSKTYTTITTETLPFKGDLAKKLTYERVGKSSSSESTSMFQIDMPVKGQILLTVRGDKIYIFQTWCPKEDYNNAIGDFTQLENNLTIPKVQNKL